MPLEAADVNTSRVDETPQLPLEIPVRPRRAAEQIQAEGSMLWKRMAGEVRLGEHADARDASLGGKLMPLGLGAWMEAELLHHARKHRLQRCAIAQPVRRASVRFDDPLDAGHAHRLFGR